MPCLGSRVYGNSALPTGYAAMPGSTYDGLPQSMAANFFGSKDGVLYHGIQFLSNLAARDLTSSRDLLEDGATIGFRSVHRDLVCRPTSSPTVAASTLTSSSKIRQPPQSSNVPSAGIARAPTVSARCEHDKLSIRIAQEGAQLDRLSRA